jgi:hypothetical protein
MAYEPNSPSSDTFRKGINNPYTPDTPSSDAYRRPNNETPIPTIKPKPEPVPSTMSFVRPDGSVVEYPLIIGEDGTKLVEIPDKRTGEIIPVAAELVDKYFKGEKGSEDLWHIIDGPDLTFESVDRPEAIVNQIDELQGREYEEDPFYAGFMEAASRRAQQQRETLPTLREQLLGGRTTAGMKGDIQAADLAGAANVAAQNIGQGAIGAYTQAARQQIGDVAAQAAQQRMQQARDLGATTAGQMGQNISQEGQRLQGDVRKLDWGLRRDQLINKYLQAESDYKKNELNRRIQEGGQSLKNRYWDINVPEPASIDIGKSAAIGGVNLVSGGLGAAAEIYDANQQKQQLAIEKDRDFINDYISRYGEDNKSNLEPADDPIWDYLESQVNRG